MSINIGHKDVIWNYIATFLQIGTGVILFPFILHFFPQETVAIWTIFSTIIALTTILDLGFNQSFARNISYVVSGVKELKKTGFQIVDDEQKEVDYGLMSGIIDAMRWFYSRIAILLFVLLITIGSYYIYSVSLTYKGDRNEIYISWVILCIVNSYSLYTFYYDSLMQGKGLIKRAKQIQVAGQVVYLAVAAILILFKFNLVAVVCAQVLSILVRRILSYMAIYTKDFKSKLEGVEKHSRKEILKSIYPNAVKLGFVNIGNAIVTRSSVVVGALYLSLNDMASYGITIQLIWVIGSVGTVYFTTYIPKMIQQRALSNNKEIIKIYINGCLFLLLTFVVCGGGMILLGDWALNLIGSKTPLLPKVYILVTLVVLYFDYNRGIAEWVLSTKNEIPFFKASLFTGGFMFLLLFVLLKYSHFGVWSLILAPCIAQGCYQNWKWPVTVVKELNIGLKNAYESVASEITQLLKR